MDKISEIRRLWRDRFNDSRNWMTNVFPRIYRDEEALVIPEEDDSALISMLLLRRYSMMYRGMEFPAGYIYGAATSRRQQGKGYMSQLIADALRQARLRGDYVVTLQPARRRLYGFYDRFGFSTVFYIREQRYTSRHCFTHDESQYIIETSGHDPAELAAAYRRLSSGRESTMLHSADDFKTILIDSDLDNGFMATARSVTTGDIVAIALAGLSYETIAVRDIVAVDDDAEAAVLDAVAKHYPGYVTVVEAYPDTRSNTKIFSRGMARVVNVKAFLEMMTAISQLPDQTLRVNDPIIAENRAIFNIRNGNVTVEPYDSKVSKIDLDVDISVLTSILFSTSRTGEIFSLPTARTFMSMMLS